MYTEFTSIESCPAPEHALLQAYIRQQGAYTDCYAVNVHGIVPHSDFVHAFYTSAVFKLERLILQCCLNKPSTDFEARQLAECAISKFAAWRVESRAADQLLMCDFLGRTRSWLMAHPWQSESGYKTRLYFGSAIVARRRAKDGKRTIGIGFKVMLGFHRLYSRVLLHSAKSLLRRNNPD